MKKTSDFEFNDLQGLLRFGYGGLTDTCFMLLDVVNVDMAREWLSTAPISSGIKASSLPDTAMQIAFSKEGLSALEISKTIIDGFSDEFIYGMVRSDNCSRRLGDVGHNAPKSWKWGNNAVPHVLLLLYAKQGGIDAWRKTVEDELFKKAFRLIRLLPTTDTGGNRMEPFGFEDGISQPTIDWALRQGTDPHERDRYSNLLAAGEMVLGYKNEYGQYTERPLIDPAKDPLAEHLPNAEDDPTLKDFARNGTYLILRELGQDVPGFWQFLDKVSDSEPNKREKLAAFMVGRERDGTPLIAEHIPGVSRKDHGNNFTYDLDANGVHCPISAHVRRANPRTGDLPSGVTGFISQLIRILGFGQKNHDADLVASSRFHRILRRGRSYGPTLSPEEAIQPDAPIAERGLQFICLAANISRQFEFVQNSWIINSKFGGLQQESDPLLGDREPLLSGENTDQFNHLDSLGAKQKVCHLPNFVTVHGGGYFFMPGLRALKYISSLTTKGSHNES